MLRDTLDTLLRAGIEPVVFWWAGLSKPFSYTTPRSPFKIRLDLSGLWAILWLLGLSALKGFTRSCKGLRYLEPWKRWEQVGLWEPARTRGNIETHSVDGGIQQSGHRWTSVPFIGRENGRFEFLSDI